MNIFFSEFRKKHINIVNGTENERKSKEERIFKERKFKFSGRKNILK